MSDLVKAALVMTSTEIAVLTGRHHNRVMGDIDSILGNACFDFYVTPVPCGVGEEVKLYELPKKECFILISSYKLTTPVAVLERWKELEQESEKLNNNEEQKMSINVRAMIDKETMTVSSMGLVGIINEDRNSGILILYHDDFLIAAKRVIGEDVFNALVRTKVDFLDESFDYLELPMIEACNLVNRYSVNLGTRLREAFNEVEQKQAVIMSKKDAEIDSLIVDLSAYVKGINKRIEEQGRVIIHAKQAIEADKLELKKLDVSVKILLNK